MRVLTVAPSWPKYSELWLTRMMELTAPNLVGFACFAPPVSSFRNSGDEVPVIDLLGRAGPVTKRLRLPMALRYGAARRVPELGGAAIRSAIERLEVDVTLCHYAGFASLYSRTWRRSGTPLAVHCHGFDVPWELPDRSSTARVLHDRRITRLKRLADHALLVANSHFTADRLRAIGVPADRIHVKPLSVPVPAAFVPHPTRTGPLELLYLGRLVDFKGPVETIRAFDLARRQGLDARLTIAGDGSLRKQCEAEARESSSRDHIRFLGAVDAQTGARLRGAADIFTAHNRPSTTDGQVEAFGVSVVEAMADGLPIVTAASGAVTETVVHLETGLLVSPGDIDGHAEALLALGRSAADRERMGRSGWARARELFSPERERASLDVLLRAAIQLGPKRQDRATHELP